MEAMERKKERKKQTNKQTNAEANAPRPSEPTKRPAKRSVDDEWGQRSKSNWPIKNKRRRKETRPAPFWKWKEINNTLPKLGNKTERERERERERNGAKLDHQMKLGIGGKKTEMNHGRIKRKLEKKQTIKTNDAQGEGNQ